MVANTILLLEYPKKLKNPPYATTIYRETFSVCASHHAAAAARELISILSLLGWLAVESRVRWVRAVLCFLPSKCAWYERKRRCVWTKNRPRCAVLWLQFMSLVNPKCVVGVINAWRIFRESRSQVNWLVGDSGKIDT